LVAWQLQRLANDDPPGFGVTLTSYLFFFSYSRADWEYDVYLERFFADLDMKVAMVTGAGTRKVGFRDEKDVKTGDDWAREISAAVQTSPVLVCIYTPNFFSAERTHEFCGKEFMAFLKRNPSTATSAWSTRGAVCATKCARRATSCLSCG
jgi:hypothetical protein